MLPHGKKKPLSKAEKQRRYRERRDRDPQRRAEYLAKSRQKYETDKSVGKRKTIAEMSDRDQRHTRRKWRLDQLNHRRKLKEHEALELIVTPPTSPDGSQHEHLNDRIPIPGPSNRLESPQNPGHSRQMQADRKNKAKKKSQCYRDNVKLEKKVDNLVKRVNMYKQRWIREKHKDGATPRSKTKALLRNFSLPKTREKVRKQLAFNSPLVEEIRKKYQKGNRKEKNYIISIAAGRLIKRSRLLEFASEELGVSNSHGKRKKKKCLTIRLGKQIRTFFERDDVSKLTPGVKQTITRLKVKMLKRILVDSLTNLHKKFLQEHKETKISYTSFCRLRPFWVVSPTEKDRDTCACKLHENIKLLVQSLNSMELLQSNDMRELVSLAVCDVEDKNCMYNDCITCGGRSLVKKERDNTKNVDWSEWTTKRETWSVKSEKKEITITLKEKQQGKLMQLVEKFDEEMVRFKWHIFNITSQMRYYTELKESLNENEVLIHVDFAENYLTKMSTEIQSMHFGASKSQITLHTGVYHMKDQKNPISFCTVSDSLKHGPAAIWAYLDPVLTEIQEKYPLIDTIHFFSDGPSTQYRQKNNFFLFTQELSERGLKSGTWNFHESGHGKGAPDGIGGAIKRTANRYVLHGKDITNAKEFVDALRESQSNVVLYEVQDDMIEQKQKKIPSKFKTVPGTQKIHQIVYEAECPGVIYVRDISCCCRFTDPHEQHELTKVNFPKKDFPKRDYPKKDVPKKDFPKKDFPKREEENQHTLSEPIDETVESKDQANEQQNEFENHEIEMETNVTCENYEMATKASSENNKMATDETGENNEMATNITSENNEMATNVTSEKMKWQQMKKVKTMKWQQM